jgi:hypothetical protein
MALWFTVAPVLPPLPLPLLGEVARRHFTGERCVTVGKPGTAGRAFSFSQSGHRRVVSQAFAISSTPEMTSRTAVSRS